MVFYCNSKDNKVYVEISKNFYGVDIYSQGVKPLESEVYDKVDFDLVLSREEVFSRYHICDENHYEFPRENKKKKDQVEDKLETEIEETKEVEKVSKTKPASKLKK